MPSAHITLARLETAVIAALQDGRLGGAYLDVFETEPLPADSPLWSLKNVILTPHVADSVPDWPARFAAFFADNLESSSDLGVVTGSPRRILLRFYEIIIRFDC